jgi:hypothetical protein
MSRHIVWSVAALTALTLSVRAQQQTPAAALAALKTTAEASDFRSTSTYDDVVKFMKTVDDASPTVFYTTYGKTFEGREMPLVVVGTGLKDASPAAVKATGKLRVHIQGNIHAGEVEGKESALILLRELALGRHDEWLRSTVFLITPIFNADGNERFALTNRQQQNGPINGMGTRQNAQNLNINRDFMKLDTPEGRAFVKLWNDYDPHVGFDLHTSDGSFHAYYLTYSPPLNPDTSTMIMDTLKNEWFPFVTRTMKSQYGWDTFYYGTAGPAGGRGGRAAAGSGDRAGAPATPSTPPLPPGVTRAWSTFEHVPRYHNNYVGLRNRFGLLSEAYAYATFEDRIKATNRFLDAALTFAHEHAAQLKKLCADADKERIVGKEEATRSQIKRGGVVDVLMGEVEDERNPNSGAMMHRRKDVVRTEPMLDMMWFEPTLTETVPAEFYVPANATATIALLREHGVQMRQVTRPVSGVEAFTITRNTARPVTPSIDFGQHGARTIEGTWQPSSPAVPAGAWAVPMTQPLARLAFYLLAPTSDDGVLFWNDLDDVLGDSTVYPILRRR